MPVKRMVQLPPMHAKLVSGFGTSAVRSRCFTMSRSRLARSSRAASVWSPSSKSSGIRKMTPPEETASVATVGDSIAKCSVDFSAARVTTVSRP